MAFEPPEGDSPESPMVQEDENPSELPTTQSGRFKPQLTVQVEGASSGWADLKMPLEPEAGKTTVSGSGGSMSAKAYEMQVTIGQGRLPGAPQSTRLSKGPLSPGGTRFMTVFTPMVPKSAGGPATPSVIAVHDKKIFGRSEDEDTAMMERALAEAGRNPMVPSSGQSVPGTAESHVTIPDSAKTFMTTDTELPEAECSLAGTILAQQYPNATKSGCCILL
jgi:hypothetical protein